MGKNKAKNRDRDNGGDFSAVSDSETGWRLQKKLADLQVEIAHLQAWVKESGARIVIIFEGRDAAGKGG